MSMSSLSTWLNVLFLFISGNWGIFMDDGTGRSSNENGREFDIEGYVVSVRVVGTDMGVRVVTTGFDVRVFELGVVFGV